VQEIEHPRLRHDQEAVGLAARRGDLGHELARRDPNRAGDALLLPDLGPDVRSDRYRRAQPAKRTGDVEERLVQGQRFHLGRDRAEDGHDLL
jgi:hypothetical protein